MREGVPKKLRILALDGGEARCMSQLEILREFMHRLNIDTGIDRRPCDYFHWIGGVGAGGVVAALLVTFSMTVDEASLAFARLCTLVLLDEQCSTAERAVRLESVTKALLEERGISHEVKLMDNGNLSTCKVGLFYMAAINLGHCSLFRNYESRQSSYNPTVIQAIRAVWATPGLFPSVRIGPGVMEEEIVSAASGFNNPTLEILKEAHQAFGPDATVSCLLSLGAGRVAIRSVTSDGTPASKALEQLAMDCEKTADEVQRRIGRLGIYFRFSVDRGLDFDGSFSPMGNITAHTGQYLLDDAVNRGIDTCIQSSERDSHVTLEQIYHARTKSPTALRGLPPLTAFFVMRQEPMNVLIKNLVDKTSPEQHIMVLAGMGGSGKTQLTLKFARDFEQSFQLIMFIDASSADTIKKGLLARIRTLGREYNPETLEDGLDILAHSEDPMVRNWLIIYDNADDPDLDLRSFIPPCDNGSIIITTRNTTLRDMSPEGYLELDAMSPEEAVSALLQAALPSGVKATPRDRKAADAIAIQLGYLPIAIIQAGCYIRQQECLYEYEDRLQDNRKGTLERPAKNQRDTLKYGHSVYAALDITRGALSSSACHVLNLLSSVHFTNFPRPLISVAAKGGFSLEIVTLLDRPASFQTTIDFLTKIFCPNGKWDENVLANALEELQQYSLVSLVPSTSVVTLRLHPLVHAWTQDRLSSQDQELYRAAAVRLLACGAGRENTVLYDYITPHIMSLTNVWGTLHVNDRIALLRILDEDNDPGDGPLILERAQSLYGEVKSSMDESDVRALRAKLFLAGAYGSVEDITTMERMETEVMNALEASLGREDLDTIEAMINLAGTYIRQERHNDAETLLLDVIKVRTEKLGESHLDTAQAMEMLGRVYKSQKRYAEAQKLLETTLATRTKICGRADLYVIFTMMHLADALDGQDRHTEANALRQEALTLENTHLGTLHIGTLWTMIWMGGAYALQDRFEEAENLIEQALAGLREVQGPQHTETLDAMDILAILYEKNERFVDSETLRKEELASRREVQGDRAVGTLNALQALGFFYMERERYEDMLEVAKELAKGKEEVLGELHIDTIVSYSLLACAYQNTGQYQQAEEVRRREVDLRKKGLGDTHVGTFAAIGALAQAIHDQGRVIEAEALWREAIDGRKALDGEVDEALLNNLNCLSILTHRQKLLEETEKLAEEAYNGRKALQGEDHIDTMRAAQWLGRIFVEQHKFTQAEVIWAELLPRQKKLLGEDNPDTLNTTFWMGRSKYDQSSWTEAEAIWSELYQKRKVVTGEKHAETLLLLEGLANCAYSQGRRDDAVRLREEEVALKSEVLDSKNTSLYEAMERLVIAYDQVGRHDDAERVARQMVEKAEANMGPLDEWTTRCRALVAFVLHSKGQFSEAANLIQQVLKERIALWGDEHVMVARSKSRLAYAYEALGRRDEAKELAEEAVIVQRKALTPDHFMLKETVDLLTKLDTPSSGNTPPSNDTSVPHDPVPSPNTPPLVSPVIRRPPVREETIDLDGYTSPGENPQATLAPPHLITRPVSPFEQRNKFGRAPNPWSMFM